MRLPSGEMATARTLLVCPFSVNLRISFSLYVATEAGCCLTGVDSLGLVCFSVGDVEFEAAAVVGGGAGAVFFHNAGSAHLATTATMTGATRAPNTTAATLAILPPALPFSVALSFSSATMLSPPREHPRRRSGGESQRVCAKPISLCRRLSSGHDPFLSSKTSFL